MLTALREWSLRPRVEPPRDFEGSLCDAGVPFHQVA